MERKTIYVTVALRLRADLDIHTVVEEMDVWFEYSDERGRGIFDVALIEHSETVD
jgi:hypothetical protein